MNHDALRKAAILIGALDHRSADALLDQMPEEQAALVRSAVMELERVDDAEQQTVIQQFLQPDLAENPLSDDGVELALSGRALETVTYEPQRGPSPSEPAASHYLDRVDVHQLVALLCHEHPQTIAVITSQLPPMRASELLLGLPETVQAEVARRIAMLGETDPEIVREIQEAIDARLSQQSLPETTGAGGISALQAILAATDPHERARLVARLAPRDPELVQQLGYSHDSAPELQPTMDTGNPRPAVGPEPRDPDDENTTERSENVPMRRHTPASSGGDENQSPAVGLEITFADLATLDDQSLATIFHRALPESAIIALTDASQDLVDRILRQLSTRQARRLQRQMCRLGPIRLRDIEHAQLQLARLASGLCRQGLVARPPTRRPVAAAA